MSVGKVNLTSSNISTSQLEQLRLLLPEVFREGKIDWEELRAVLGDAVDPRVEKFNFTWAGKGEAIKSVLMPSKATLRPAKDEGIKFDESENIFIEGDNLEVLKLLKKAYFEKVKMIYIDPPYNTGGDFVYKDNFAAPIHNYLKQTGQKNDNGEHLTTNKETNGRFHSDWLSMMYPRLKLARDLLREDGVIFVSIDDHEVHHLRMLMDEIFDTQCFVGQFNWVKTETPSNLSETIKNTIEYVLCYRKSLESKFSLSGIVKDAVSSNPLLNQPNPESILEFPKEKTETGIPDGTYCKGVYGSARYKIELLEDVDVKDGKFLSAVRLRGKFRWAQRYLNEQIENGVKISIRTKQFIPSYEKPDYGREVPSNLINYEVGVDTNEQASSALEELMGGKYFSYPKPVSLIKYIINMVAQEGDLVLDFFGGSGTTAQAVFEISKEKKLRWICVQLPEILDESQGKTQQEKQIIKSAVRFLNSSGKPANIAELAKERIRLVLQKFGSVDGFKVFKLGESNYPENQFEFDPEKPEDEKQEAFEKYLSSMGQGKLLKDVNTLDIIYENIVKEGFSLNASIVTGVKGMNNVYTVTDGARQFSICLESHIDDATLKNLMEWAKDTVFICFDTALDDTGKANLGLHLELKTI